MKKQLLPTLLALCMALSLLPGTALAADKISVTVTPTGIRADSVINSEGYGSLKIKGNWDDYDRWDLWGEERPEGVINPQIALVDRTGKLLFPYRENDDKYARDVYYHYSDGIVSLAYGAYMEEGFPEYYRLDGTKAFSLKESTREETRYEDLYHITSTYVGGIMNDGYAMIVETDIENEDGSSMTYTNPTARKIIDKSGNVTCVLPEDYTKPVMGSMVDYSCYFNLKEMCGEGLFAVVSGNYAMGYMDVTGKMALNLEDRGFADLGSFSSGLAWVVHEDGGCGYIDKTGKLVIPCLYDTVSLCSSDGMCAVSKDGKYGYIDKTGATVIPFEYDGAYGAGAGLASVIKGGKCGLVDYSNNVVLPLEYDDITPCEGGVAYAVKGGLLYIVTWDGSGDAGTTPAKPSTPSASEQPTIPATPAPMPVVVLSPQNLAVDGKDVTCEKYNIGGSNYFKLRDLASLLDGTGSQFDVGFDEATATVSITTGEAYKQPNGTELIVGADNSATAQPSSQTILIDGEAHGELTAYNIGGSNFFQLRELGNVLGFEVDFDGNTNTAIVRSVEK